MKKYLTLLVLLLPFISFSQNRVQQYVDSKMKTAPDVRNAAVALLAVDEEDRIVASWNKDMPLLTASTLKTVTTGLGYRILGPEYRFKTVIAYDGSVTDGILDGDLYIVGGGDPTLGSRDTLALPIDMVFAHWAEAVRKAGIDSICGLVVADDRIFAKEEIPQNWVYGDIGYYYGSGTSGLNFCENTSLFSLAPGIEPGDPVAVNRVYAVFPQLETDDSELITGEAGTGDLSQYYASALAPVSKFSGTYAVDRKKDTIAFSNKYAPETCAAEFRAYLERTGIHSEGSVGVSVLSKAGFAAAPDSLVPVDTTYSPALKRIVKVTNTISNNFFAETIYKTIGKALMDASDGKDHLGVTYSQASEAITGYLQSQNLSLAGYCQDDGCGLSRNNFLSPDFFCRFYKWMQGADDFAGYLASFPQPGRPGTLKGVLRNADRPTRNAIHAKSGTMTGVRCYSGYVDTGHGYIRFAILFNNFSCPTRQMQPYLEGFLTQLSLYAQGK